jgi:hypothetical protein
MSSEGSNTSNAGGPSSMSNASRGTRVVSAGDWVRMKRLLGARNNGYSGDGYLNPASANFNKDVAPTTSLQVPYGLPIHVFPVGGNSKIRRPTSNWIDHIGFKYGDIVLSSQLGVHQPGSLIEAQRFCSCTKTNLANKDVVCRSCSTRKPQGQQQETGYRGGNGGNGGGNIVLDWQGFDANESEVSPVCFKIQTGSLLLPLTFDPCVGSFSFSFSNLVNIGNVAFITVYADGPGSTPYDFSLTNFSISGGGTIDSVNPAVPGQVEIRVTGITSSTVITVTSDDAERNPICVISDICIQSILPPPEGIRITSWGAVSEPSPNTFQSPGVIDTPYTGTSIPIQLVNIPTLFPPSTTLINVLGFLIGSPANPITLADVVSLTLPAGTVGSTINFGNAVYFVLSSSQPISSFELSTITLNLNSSKTVDAVVIALSDI